MFDDETQKEIARAAIAQIQNANAIQGLTGLLSDFRVQLINRGFSTETAEALTQDYFRSVLDTVRDQQAAADEDDE